MLEEDTLFGQDDNEAKKNNKNENGHQKEEEKEYESSDFGTERFDIHLSLRQAHRLHENFEPEARRSA